MKGFYHIHNKSGYTTPKNSNICNISFPKVFITVINQRVHRTHLKNEDSHPYISELVKSMPKYRILEKLQPVLVGGRGWGGSLMSMDFLQKMARSGNLI